MRWIYHIFKNHAKSTLLLLTLSVIMFGTAQSNLQGDEKINIITLIITVITIIVGFAMTALTIFLGIIDKPVIIRIRKRHAINQLVDSFKDLIYFGGIVIILSIFISIYNEDSIIACGFNVAVYAGLLYLFIFSTISSLYYSYRLVNIILRVFQKLITEE